MEYKIKNQRGYLLIWAMVLIIITALVGNLLVYMFMGKMGATQNDSKSNAALYITTSGLEITKRDITVNHVGCTAINGLAKYTNAALFNGMFTTTGTSSAAYSSLQSSISATDSSIALTSSSGFAGNGIIVVDSEFIAYFGISGNTLLNAIRGASGTAAVTHANSASVAQNQCIVTASGGIPTLTSPAGKRIVQQTLFGMSGFTAEGITPTIISTSSVKIAGQGEINNPLVTSSSPGFTGANIVTTGTVSLTGKGITQINDGSGGLVVSSDKKALTSDVIQNYNGITATNLFTSVFNASKPVVQATANTLINSTVTKFSTLDGLAGQTIWINGKIKFNGNGTATVGTPGNPVILIVNGDINLTKKANLIVYGILYVIGSITNNAGYIGHGQTIVEGKINFKGGGTINLDPAILAILGIQGTYTQTSYSSTIIGYPQEVFP